MVQTLRCHRSTHYRAVTLATALALSVCSYCCMSEAVSKGLLVVCSLAPHAHAQAHANMFEVVYLGNIIDLCRVRRDLYLDALAQTFQLLSDVPRSVQTSHLNVIFVAPLQGGPSKPRGDERMGGSGRGGTCTRGDTSGGGSCGHTDTSFLGYASIICRLRFGF